MTDVTPKKEEKRAILDLRKKWNNLKELEDRKGYFLDRFVPLAGIISHICREVGMSRQTYYRWMNDDEEFRNRVGDVEEDLNDYVHGQLIKLIQEGNPAAIIFYHKCKMKHRGFTEKVEHDVRGALFEHRKVEIEIVRRDGKKKKEDTL